MPEIFPKSDADRGEPPTPPSNAATRGRSAPASSRPESPVADNPRDVSSSRAVDGVGAGATRAEAATVDDARVAATLEPDDPNRATAPWLLRAAAGWSWRILVVALAVVLLLRLFAELKVLALGMVAALLLSALLYPVFRLLRRAGLPKALSAAVTVLGVLALLILALAFVGSSTVSQLTELQSSLGQGITQIQDWLVKGPIGLDQAQLDKLRESVSGQLSSNRQRLTTGAISGATAALEVLTGGLLMLFATFFFLFDGPGIWAWVVRLFHPSARQRVDGAGAVAWATVTGYIRGTVFVAAFDAFFIGLALLFVGVPLLVPLVLLTFLGGFIPIAGATLAGIAAVLIALVSKGFVAALIIAGAVLAVQQIEGHILQPLVLGHSVRLHPLAIVLSIAGGATLAGIPGAIVAVPAVAVLNRVASYLVEARAQDAKDVQDGARPGSVPAAQDVRAAASRKWRGARQ